MSNVAQQRVKSRFPRNYLAADATVDTWESIAPYFDELEARDISEKSALEKWLADYSELSAAIGEESSARYIAMTCHTDDADAEKLYLDYVTTVVPQMEPHTFELSKKYLASPARQLLPPERYFVYDRSQENDVALFREENIALQTRDEVLSQLYQKQCGDQMVHFDGKEQTLPQLGRYYEETDRGVRHDAWVTAVQRQLEDREAFETVFDEMIQLRTEMAKNAGYSNFLEYQFKRLRRFDYTPQDCEAFHNAIASEVVPLRRALNEERRKKLGLPKLAPWDLDVDPLGRPPLRPFTGAQELVGKTDAVFAAVDPRFAQDFDILKSQELLDLESRKGKAPGGYQSTLDEARLPFIFMNASGRNRDVFTLIHEGGHAFHALAYRDEPLHAYRTAPIEFCEVASMGMEMMACEHLEPFYSGADAERARKSHLESIIMLLPWIARVDAFQHWLYKNPAHTRQERAAQWLELESRFGDGLEWPELAEWRECSWMAKLHFFCVPLYYIEYGIAQLGALKLWQNYRADSSAAVAAYRDALKLGNSRPLPELFSTAGLQFKFDAPAIRPLVEELSKVVRG